MKNSKSYSFALIAFFALLIFNSGRSVAQARDSVSIETSFLPAGYMGCTASIFLDDAWRTDPHSAPLCNKITYATTCTKKWAGIYWTNRDDGNGGANWGQYPGNDYSTRSFTKVTFWAKGASGGEVVEFGTFGVDNKNQDPTLYKYADGCPKVDIKTVLTNTWKKYTIDVSSCKNMNSVIGGFYWTASYNSNPAGLVFYLDDMQFER